jgi:hypothetical protein
MTSSQGPFLYDDDPEPLHTGAPQRSGKIMVLILGGTVVAAFVVVLVSLLLRGTAGEQATEVTGVFFAALAADDTETAYGLLCEEERARLAPGEVAGEYLGEGSPELGEPGRDGDVRLVPVRWADGATSELSVIGEDGLRICGKG